MAGPQWLPNASWYTWGKGINDLGTIIVTSTYPYPNTRSLLWRNTVTGYEGPVDLLGSIDPRYSEVVQINKLGQVLGRLADSDNTAKLYLWDNSNLSILPFPGVPIANSAHMNNLGQVVAKTRQTINGMVVDSVVVWDGEDVLDIGTDCSNASIVGINDYMQIAGTCYFEGQPHGAVWENGNWMDLGSLGTYGSLASMNNVGQFVGQRSTDDGRLRATLWTIPPSPLASLPAVDDIGDIVQELTDTSQIADAEGTALLVQLDVVKSALSNYRTEAACRLLDALSREVEAKVRAGRLSPEDGQLLTDAAGSVSTCTDQ